MAISRRTAASLTHCPDHPPLKKAAAILQPATIWTVPHVADFMTLTTPPIDLSISAVYLTLSMHRKKPRLSSRLDVRVTYFHG